MVHPLDDSRLDSDFLRRFDFDKDGIRAAMDRMIAGELTTESARVTGRIEPAPEVTDLDFDGDTAAAVTEGESALKRGEVAVVVLNGGMATRFGGVVKGVVEVFD
ncbi:MAG: UTP--glucose-1-phosphate uridylyltransferase, partial [Myxococcota bacterium]